MIKKYQFKNKLYVIRWIDAEQEYCEATISDIDPMPVNVAVGWWVGEKVEEYYSYSEKKTKRMKCICIADEYREKSPGKFVAPNKIPKGWILDMWEIGL